MKYRGFEITACNDDGVEQPDEATGKSEVCKGFYCQVYPEGDEQYACQIDDFCLAAGYEIPDTSDSALEDGITRYVDNMYEVLRAAKEKAMGAGLPSSYFMIRGADHTAWYATKDVRNVAEVAAMLTRAYEMSDPETEDSAPHLIKHSGVSFQEIAEAEYLANARAFRSFPSKGILVELDLKRDFASVSNWDNGSGGKRCTVSAMLSRLMGIYELALTRTEPQCLDMDAFTSGLLNHCFVETGISPSNASINENAEKGMESQQPTTPSMTM